MRLKKTILTSLLLSLVFLIGVNLCWARSPMDTIKEGTDKVIDVLKNPQLKGPEHTEIRRQKIWEIISEYFDFNEMARRSLGRYWRKLKSEQRKEFVDLFSYLLQKSYIGKIDKYTDEKVMYDNEKTEGRYASVKTIIHSKNDVQIPVIYRLKKKGDSWMVYDVVIEGVSLVNNYRAQFNSIIVSKSYDDLIEKLRKKKEEDGSEGSSTTHQETESKESS